MIHTRNAADNPPTDHISDFTEHGRDLDARRVRLAAHVTHVVGPTDHKTPWQGVNFYLCEDDTDDEHFGFAPFGVSSPRVGDGPLEGYFVPLWAPDDPDCGQWESPLVFILDGGDCLPLFSSEGGAV